MVCGIVGYTCIYQNMHVKYGTAQYICWLRTGGEREGEEVNLLGITTSFFTNETHECGLWLPQKAI